jgi:hypothetical protein
MTRSMDDSAHSLQNLRVKIKFIAVHKERTTSGVFLGASIFILASPGQVKANAGAGEKAKGKFLCERREARRCLKTESAQAAQI